VVEFVDLLAKGMQRILGVEFSHARSITWRYGWVDGREGFSIFDAEYFGAR
jgi:hypothetical protein